MKKKNRTGILTALLAVSTGVESMKRIGIITALLAVLLFASIPVQATIDPTGCFVNSVKVRSTAVIPGNGVNGQTVFNFGILVGTGGDSGACNVGPAFSSDGTGTGVTITFFKPDKNGNPTVGPSLIDSNRSYKSDGTADTCYYSSDDINNNFCKLNNIIGARAIFVPSMQWLADVNPGITQADANAVVTCPDGKCSHQAVGDLGGDSNLPVRVILNESIPNTILTKTANPKSGTSLPFTVTYTYTEKNTGNVNLANVNVTDSNCVPTLVGAPFTKQQPLGLLNVLEPGATATFTCTKTYNTSGTFVNTGFGHGNPTYYDPVTNTDVISSTDITAPEYPGEQATETVTVSTPTPTPTPPPPPSEEHWNVEWINTMPWQYTQFTLPEDQDYLVTSGFMAPEARTKIFDGVPTPLAVNEGDRLKFWTNSTITDDLYVNAIGGNTQTLNGGNTQTLTASLKLYGYFDEGAGDLNAIDPVTNKKPEQAPYTNPIAPFYPQSNQSPRKDFVTFNPAIMDHNQGYPELIFLDPSNGNTVQRPQEKVFKRMWYEKAWFKDDYQAQANGHWDVVIEACEPLDPRKTCQYVTTLPLDDEKAINDQLIAGNRIRENNNDPALGDTYAPAIEQEFAYMTLNDLRMPILVKNGSHILIPMAHQAANSYRGINSFDAANQGVKDAVRVESEKTLGMDIDNDGKLSSMDTDGKDVSGDESIVLVLDNKNLSKDSKLQFFDNVVTLRSVFTAPQSIVYDVCDNEGGDSTNCEKNQNLAVGQVAKYQRGMKDDKGPFYIKLIAVDENNNQAVIEVGRMFGQTLANIGANARWNQKSFIVDEVFYNVAGIKAKVVNGVEQFKYIVIRQKLPKEEIKLYGKHLKVWEINEVLPEMPPFNMQHEIIVDILETQDRAKIGNKIEARPLEITYIRETKEKRFVGELKEIYNQTGNKEAWVVEWFNTMPFQYTEFVLPSGQKYLVTTGFRAPESVTSVWDGDVSGNETPIVIKGDRLKFWHDASIAKGLYINDGTLRLYGYFDEGPGDLTVIDPVTNKKPEQAPYTDPEAPFYPQSGQSPRKDFVTFNPAIMDHNQGYPELIFLDPSNGNTVQRPQEKVFKRMWYEKALFKDDYQAQANGHWDVVIEACKPLDPRKTCQYVTTVQLDDEQAIQDQLEAGNRIREHNNDPSLGDTYAPAIEQEFAYMTLNDIRMPIEVKSGSHILIPMAHQATNSYRGINSFDAANKGVKDAVKVESEKTLNMDIDGDGIMSSMDTDGTDVSGDESIVLVLDNKKLSKNDKLQFFDNVVTLKDVMTTPASITYDICDNEGGGSQNCARDQVLKVGDVANYQRGMNDVKGPFYIKLIAVDQNNNQAVIEVGRMFGQTLANIGANPRWNQKAFIVDEIFYNVVAIKTKVVNGVEQFKYIVIRQKLPKEEIKLYGKHLGFWSPEEILPELPPFNMNHEIIVDVLRNQALPANMQDKIGKKIPANPLEITYVVEAKEPRFQGQLKEIYAQNNTSITPEPTTTPTTPTPTQTPVPTIDGAALYASNCASASCHGPLATSSKRDRTAANIQNAINGIPAMSSLSFLSQAQIQAIANALSTTATPTATATGTATATATGTATATTTGTATATATATPGTTCQGDITGDGAINSADFVIFASAYNSASGDPRFNVKADLNNNGSIDSADFVLFASKYGTSCNAS